MKKLILVLSFIATLFFAMPAFAYTVEKGDTMMKIARDHGVTLEQLVEANPQIENLNLIRVGQKINININKETPTNQSKVHQLFNDNNSPLKIAVSIDESIEKDVKANNVSDINGLTKAEIDLLARIVRAEAQAESFEGKVAVAAVVLNRLESSQFPDTVREVIYQPKQFQPVKNGQINKPADKESYEAVYRALTDMRNIVKDSLFFYNPKIATSRWLDTRRTTVVIGNHVFKK